MRAPAPLTAVLLAGVTAVALTGCVPFIAAGPMTSEEREIDAVTTVVLDTSGDITISEGEPKLVIHASAGTLERLTTEINGDVLVLGSGPGLDFGLGEVRYDLTLPDLERIEVNGSGDIESTVPIDGTFTIELDGSGDIDIDGLDTDRIDVSVSGSGDVELVGTTTELAIELDGSGDISADDLDAQEAVVAINGSGNIEVRVRDNLFAEIAGSGRIAYSGDPVVESEVTGSGSIERSDD